MDKKPKKTTLSIISNIYREATEYDMGKVLTISKSIVSTLQGNQKLNTVAKSNPGSLVNCVRQAISLGLTIDANNYCYLVPYGDCLTLSIGYQGYLYKIRQNYPKVIIQACLVYKDDEIEFFKKENNDYVNHKYKNPFSNKKEDIIGVYSIITFENGKKIIDIINKEELNLIKSKAKTKYIWNEWTGEMCKKSVIRRACKTHFSSEIVELNKFDNQIYDITPKPKKTAGLEKLNNV